MFADAETMRLWLKGERHNDVVRRNLGDGSRVELRALGVGEATKGEKAVGESLADVLIQRRDETAVVRSVATLFPTDNGQPLSLPAVNDVANAAELKGENDDSTEETDIVVSSVDFGAYTYSSRVIVSRELLQDAGPAVQKGLGIILGKRVGRAVNSALSTGTGSDSPLGIFAGATIAKTVAADDALTYVDLVDLMNALGDSYHLNAAFMCRRATLTAIMKIIDGAQRPVFNVDNGTLFGKPVIVNQHAPAMAADAKAIIYGDFSCYGVRETALDLQYRQEERAEYHQSVIAAIARVDGRYLDANGVVALRMAGS